MFKNGWCLKRAKLRKDFKVIIMTMFEKLRSKNIDELADWLDKYGNFEDSPWVDWWNDNYCAKCQCKIVEYHGIKLEISWCETHHGKCKFFKDMDEAPSGRDIVKMWLVTEVEDERTD